MEQGTAIGDIAAGDPPSDLASSVPALILLTPDGPDPPSDLDVNNWKRLIQDTNTLVGRCPTPVKRCLGVQFDRPYLRLHHSFSGSPFCECSAR